MKKLQVTLMVLGVLLIPLTIIAADMGKIQGEVINEKTGEPLPSANIIVKLTPLGVI